jgi:RNA polymerase sigma-70 factor (ECF subfamily)
MNSSPRSTEPPPSFVEVAVPWFDAVHRFARHLTGETADAEDLVQETYLRALRGWHTFQSGSDCRRWLFTICRNALIQGLRKPTPLVTEDAELEALAAAAVHAGAAGSGTSDLFSQVDLRDAIQSALADLPHAFREVVVLVDIEGLRYDEAAPIMGVPVGTVRSRLFRGRRLLQQTLLSYARDAGLVASGPDGQEGTNG